MRVMFSEWLYSLKHYLRICLFLSSPSDLPPSGPSVVLSLVAYFMAAHFLLGDQYSTLSIGAHIGVELLILYGFSFAVLRYQHKLSRLLQTLSALIGSSLVISLISLPLMAILPETPAQDSMDSLALKLNLLLMLWNLAVISLIFKRAFELSTIAAGFLAFNYFLLYELVVINLLQ